MLNRLAPELATCRPGDLASAKLPHLKFVIRMGRDASPGMLNFDALLAQPPAPTTSMTNGADVAGQFILKLLR